MQSTIYLHSDVVESPVYLLLTGLVVSLAFHFKEMLPEFPSFLDKRPTYSDMTHRG